MNKMRYKVIRDCHGFLGRYWKKETIVDPKQFYAKWPKNEDLIPKHFVEIDENDNELVKEQEEPKDETFTMGEFSENKSQKPETISNQPMVVKDDKKTKEISDNKKVSKKATKR
ncbi:MAG: hypothetical protein GY797_33400 [Deltaproteobacteria bacterium]|nr:hypothetical protein [Deltaproteobacteria bacterium]